MNSEDSKSTEKLPLTQVCQVNQNNGLKVKEKQSAIQAVKEEHLLTIAALPNAISKKRMLNVIQFYCNVLSRSGPGVPHCIDNLTSLKNETLSDIKDVSTSKNLKEFFSKFPQLFSVHGNKVILRNWIIFHINQQEWLKELLSKRYHSGTSIQLIISTIQFYCNELFTKALDFELPVSKLFSLKSNAPVAIQAVIKSIKEFIIFLQSHPEIFIFRSDKVTLTDSAKSIKSMTTRISRWIDFIKPENTRNYDTKSSELLGIQTYDVARNEFAINEAVAFYYKIILNGSSQGISLHNLISKRNKATPKIQAIAKNWRELKVLLSCYPQVFTLNNDIAILTHLLKDTTIDNCKNVDGNHLNCAFELRDDTHSKNNEKLVIDFYSNILCKISQQSDKIAEFPIENLYYYSLEAPLEVNKIITNAAELKKFLLKYPNVFKICGDHISIQQKTNAVPKNKARNPTTSIIADNYSVLTLNKYGNEAIDFYSKLLIAFGGTARIDQLLNFKSHSSTDVQNIAKKLDELKKFFNTNSNTFIVENNTVLLTNNILKDRKDSENTKNMHVEEYEIIKNKAIFFYSNFIMKRRNQLLPLNTLIGYRSCAPADVQSVAKNPKELKAFLSQFPEVFTIVKDSVQLSNFSHGNLINQDQQYLLPNDVIKCNSNPQDAIEFYSDMLNCYGTCRVLSINKLFEYKLRSSLHVQNISGSNIDQFRQFLMQYPDYFIVTSDNVIGKRNIPKWTYSNKYEEKKFTDPLLIVIYNFFQTYTMSKSLIHIDNLYNNIGRFFLYGDQVPIFESKSDLLLFLALYPHVFYVDNDRVVNLITSSKTAFISPVETCRPRNKNYISPKKKKTKTLQSTVKNTVSVDRTKTVEVDTLNKDLIKNIRKYAVGDSEVAISLAEVSENNKKKLEKQFCNHSRTVHKDGFKPLSIEEIEVKFFAQFTNKLSEDKCKQVKENKEDHPLYAIQNSFPRSLRKRGDFSRLTLEALIFLNCRLWENEQLTILKIEELFKLFFISPLEIKKYYCRNLDEFNNFLFKFPNDFVISNGNVMAKKNKIRGSCYFESIEVESLPKMLFNFFNLYTQYNNYINLELLYKKAGNYFLDANWFQIFKFSKDLILFLKMFPDVFYLEHDHVINLTALREKHENLNEKNVIDVTKHCIKSDSFAGNNYYTAANVPESTDGWKNFVLQRTQVIEDINQCLSVTAAISESEKVIALDCEGVNLGVGGILTLVQVGLENGQIYIFDVIKDKTMVTEGGLKNILESKSIVKVIHDSRNDAANLYTEFNVDVNNIFDTRIAHHLIATSSRTNNKLTAIGFNELCKTYDVPINIEKDEMKNVYKYNYMFWMSRPLTKDMIAYAALDVASLVPHLYQNLLKKIRLTKVNLENVWKMSFKHSISNLVNKKLLFD